MGRHDRESEIKKDSGIVVGNFKAPFNERDNQWQFPGGEYVSIKEPNAYAKAFNFAKRYAWKMECALEKQSKKIALS